MQETRSRALQALAVETIALQHASTITDEFSQLSSAIEEILVALLGHWDGSSRRRAMRLLNSMYDGTDWQLDAPFVQPVVVASGASPQLRIMTAHVLDDSAGDCFRVLLSTPSAKPEGPHTTLNLLAPDSIQQNMNADGTAVVSIIMLQLPAFAACGFYDWRLVSVNSSGQTQAVRPFMGQLAEETQFSTFMNHYEGTSVPPGSSVAQGRFIVQPKHMANARVHECLVDLEGTKYDAAGQVTAHGTFDNITAKVPDMAASGVGALLLSGAMQRDNGWMQSAKALDEAAARVQPPTAKDSSNSDMLDTVVKEGRKLGLRSSDDDADSVSSAQVQLASGAASTRSVAALPPPPPPTVVQLDAAPGQREYAARPDASPHAVVCRTSACAMLGGDSALQRLVAAAKQHGVGTLLPVEPHVAAARAHRRYRHLTVDTLDDSGCPVRHPGTDGSSNQWEDTNLLNYRRLETWELLVSEVQALATQWGVSGAYLVDASSLPVILEADMPELYRRDVDGEASYTTEDAFFGRIVVPNAELGYWADAATSAARFAATLAASTGGVASAQDAAKQSAQRLAGTASDGDLMPAETALSSSNMALYANPLYVKLCRSVWRVAPQFALVGQAHGGRHVAVARGGLIPHQASLPAAFARTVARSVGKTGVVRYQPLRNGEAPVDALQVSVAYDLALSLPGIESFVLRGLTSSRSPYPPLLLERAAWPAIDVVRCLPGAQLTFGAETQGTGYRLDLAGAYTSNTGFREIEARRAEARRQRERAAQSATPWVFKHAKGGLVLRTKGGSTTVDTPLLMTSGQGSKGGELKGQSAASAAAAASGSSFQGEGGFGYDGHIGVGGVVPAMPLRPVRLKAASSKPKQELSSDGSSGVGGMRPSASTDSLASRASGFSQLQMDGPESTPTGSPSEALLSSSDPNLSALVAAGTSSSQEGGAADMFEFLSDAGSVYAGEGDAIEGDDLFGTQAFGADDSSLLSCALQLAGDSSPAIVTAALAIAGEGRSNQTDLLALHSQAEASGEGQAVAVGAVAADAARSTRLVESWAARGDSCFGIVGEGSTVSQHDGPANRLAWLEGELRARVGPQFGFDTQHLPRHYGHRDVLRAAYPALRFGKLALLSAQHRYGEHGHVMAFARYTWYDSDGAPLPVGRFGAVPNRPADEVAIIACNFNQYPSVVSVDASPLAGILGASPRESLGSAPAPHSASTHSSELMQSPTPPATMRKNYSISDLLQVEDVSEQSDGAMGSSVAAQGIAGGIWEARDVFQASLSHAKQRAAALDDALQRGERSLPAPLEAADGPLIGFLTSDEVAYAPMQTTLPAYRSVCWLLQRRDAAPADTGAAASSTSADLQWVFASAALRLQTMLHLPALGTGTAVRTLKGNMGVGDPIAAAAGAAASKPATGRAMGPGEALTDGEIQRFARHNLLFATLRRVVTDTVQHCKALQADGAGTASELFLAASSAEYAAASQLPAGGDVPVGDDLSPSKRATAEDAAAARMAVALRSIAKHMQLSVGSSSAPLPPGHLRGGKAWTQSLVSTPLPQLDEGAPDADRQWGAVDVDVLVTLLRTSLFMAARDEGVHLSTSLLLRALARVARGAHCNTSKVTAGQLLAGAVAQDADVGPIVLVTPELGKWSTVGGLGVMVDELTTTLADMGHDITVVAPFYNLDRKGRGDYLRPDGILYSGRNVGVSVGGAWTEFGVHEGRVNGVRLLFLHNAQVFPRPYPTLDAKGQLAALVAMAKASLEALCQWRIVPGVVITNDWFTGLVPAYARAGHFGATFDRTSFMHICHNLDPSYEGRLYPSHADGDLHWLHQLPNHLLIDDTWSDIVINPSRCAIMASDSWGTVSKSYRSDLLNGSPLRHLLRAAAHPFGHPNGIPIALREARLAALPTPTHETAKAALQRKYFGMKQPDLSIPLFGFVGRITLQKGVHLILNAVEHLLHEHQGRVQFIIGGMASESDTYGCACAAKMRQLAASHPGSFWADPTFFFTDGPLLNLGGDAGMMPSLFEPGGIVQQEHFVAGTPVLAFRTGGLKDTIEEFSPATLTGNGFLFEAHRPSDFIACTNRAIEIIRSPALYARLRANAKASVVGLHTVASAWSGEIHRMERCLSAPSGGASLLPATPPQDGEAHSTSAELPPLDAVRIVVRLGVGEIPEAQPGSTVQVAGPLVGGWDVLRTLKLTASGTSFELPLMLQAGKYPFKFVVDGTWTCSGYQRLERDEHGNANHVLEVLEPAVLAQ